MLSRLLRRPLLARATQIRHINVPFKDDLVPVDEELFNLEGFRDYKESPDVRAYRERLGMVEEKEAPKTEKRKDTEPSRVEESKTLAAAVARAAPMVFESKLNDPYLNLAIEDYVYHNMPVPAAGEPNCNRLMFYVNSPCVVIGKNQNPWREVNMPLLNSLRLPLVRRRSGGGTVVHDTGNVNYSFMTTKENFDRKAFANIVCESVNKIASEENQITVNERGDIVTIQANKKVSGSAYKLTKGRSYHHGTMLLNSRLDVLRQLLHRDETKVGTVTSTASVASVKSPVANIGLATEEFVEAVSSGFKDAYGSVKKASSVEKEPENMDENEFLGLEDFVNAFSERECEKFIVDESTELPQEVTAMKNELMSWQWKFGTTAKFTHRLAHPKKPLAVEFDVVKGKLQAFRIEGGSAEDTNAMEFLGVMLERKDEVPYTGSDVAGFITDDELSEWIGNSIDGSS